MNNKISDDSLRRENRSKLAYDVAALRNSNLESFCETVRQVNDLAVQTQEFISDRRESRLEPRLTLFSDLKTERARIRADMERIVSTDF